MKTYYIILLIAFLTACNDEFLNEKPSTFLAPENSYATDDGLVAGAIGLYDIFVAPYTSNGNFEDCYILLHQATDIVRAGFYPFPASFAEHNSDYTPLSSFTVRLWRFYYRLANNAAVVIDRSKVHEWKNIEAKKQAEGEAQFFRAYAHFYLSQLWGPIPLISNETSGAKLDYQRNSIEEVFQLIESDLKAAEENLKYEEYAGQPGRITKGAVQHLLAYAYLAFGKYKEAEVYAKKLIDSGHYAIMNQRFGSQMNNAKGNVFWDLYQTGNQNRSSGNKEGILVIQNEDINKYPTVGSNDNSSGVFVHPRQLYPPSWLVNGIAISEIYGGRGIGRNATTLFWLDNFNPSDIRGKMPCLQTVFTVNNPNAIPPGMALGDTLFDYRQADKFSTYPKDDLRMRPYPTKWNWRANETSNNATFVHDLYVFRVSDTYLVLAEALLMQNDKTGAANYINIVRRRAGAPDISAADVTVDFILDERGRELWGEVPRRVDLYRTGKYLERTRLYNPEAGPNLSEKHTLLPIPQSEIDRNSGAVLEQNPGW